MAAPKGNQFWKLRSKHGRDKLFVSADLLWEAACEYFQWCDNNPWYKVEQVKSPARPVKNKDGDYTFPSNTVNIPTARPYTMQGLCSYLDCNTDYFRQFKKNLKPAEEDFAWVITRIEDAVYQQKFEGAAVGAFNANIIARDLGLTEKVDQKQDLTIKGVEVIVRKTGLPQINSEKDIQ